MAKKIIIAREKKRQFLVDKFSSKREFLKEQIRVGKTFDQRFSCLTQLRSLPRNSSRSRLF
jgi:small subunit ribosomal protein S14